MRGTGKLPKITNLTMLGTLLHKHPRTIKREIARGLVEHVFDEGLQTKTVYNADYAENMARAKDSGKGPDLKLGRDYILAKEIGRLMKELHYSPYAVLAHFQNEGWPTDTRICEKTLYSYVYEGLIPDVSVKDLFLQGKSRKSPGGKKNHRNAALAAKSITTRPEEVSTRKDFGHWEGDTVVSGKGKGSECLLTMTEKEDTDRNLEEDSGQECTIRS
ncbi:MAG: IS30 family transposase [Sphaerochaeta sp.]|nr:IS30 family transposase [Sphaerochaeta sp.]